MVVSFDTTAELVADLSAIRTSSTKPSAACVPAAAPPSTTPSTSPAATS